MVNIIIHGVNGFMGRVLTDLISAEPDCRVVAGIDIVDNADKDFPVYTNVSDCREAADVIIDFSNAKAVDALVDYCADRKLPVVLCTTGLSEEQLSKIKLLSESVPVLRSANMSVGVNTIFDILRNYSKVFADAGFDIEIVEKHHNRKLDAPSGTALALGDAINEGLSEHYDFELDRASKNEKRPKNQIGIVAVRGGNIVGEHEVIFAGMDEVITIKHTATSRGVFATGAIQAAKFLAGTGTPGLYNMEDVIKTNF